MARTADWRIDLMKAHPRLFEIMTGEPEPSFGYPLCEAGWRDVLVRLCTRIEDALQDNETFQFVRIKQKFGIARFDWDGEASDETGLRIDEAINLAVARSACTCEICGAEGHLYGNRGWLATRCADHRAGDRVPVAPGFENVRILRRRPGRPDMYHARYDRETDTLKEISSPSQPPEEWMAKFRCRACGKEGTFVYDPRRHTCPLCDSIDVQFAIGVEELPDDDPLIEAMKRLAEEDGKNED